MNVTSDWYWEGNVVRVIATYLEREGWKMLGQANTLSRERGVDIQAQKGEKTLLIEAKGFPSKAYRDPRRATELKPTNPTNQAQHWYSHALLKVVRLQTQYPDAIVAIGLPDFPRYRALLQETQLGLQRLGVGVLIARESGEVDARGISTDAPPDRRAE